MKQTSTHFSSLQKSILIVFFGITILLLLRTFWTLSQGFAPDFSVYYGAAKQIATQRSVYTDVGFTLFGYPVVSGIFFIPFIFLPYQIAQELFLIFNFLFLLGISLIIPYIFSKKSSYLLSAFIYAFSYFAFPTKFTLGMGQSNLLVLLLLLLSLLFYTKSKKLFLTAIFFSLAALIKPILGFMILFFIIRKEWRILFYIIICLSCGFIFSIGIDRQALSDYLYYITVPVPHLSLPVGREIYYNQSLMGFIFRSFTNQPIRVAVSYTGMLILFLTTVSFSIKQKSNFLGQFALILTALPMLDTLSWQHHFVFLIFPFTYTFFAIKNTTQKNKLYILLFIAYILVLWNFKNPSQFSSFPFSLLLSHVFYGTLLLFSMQLFLVSNEHRYATLHQKKFQKKKTLRQEK